MHEIPQGNASLPLDFVPGYNAFILIDIWYF